MRMRKKKHAEERIQACKNYLNWREMPENGKKLSLEIGCGKGDFICSMAQNFPDVNFIAIEKVPDVAVIALEKAKSLNLQNVRFIIGDAKEISNNFEPGKISVSVIYLNFSDPWHKRYHQDKRLTSPTFLEIYKKILSPGAKIILKTDNINFFGFSLKTLPSNGFQIEAQTYDLYSSEFLDGNVQTEYEKKFVEQNTKICYLRADFTDFTGD